MNVKETMKTMVKSEPLYLIPLTLRQANEFADKHRRDHRPIAYDKFSIGCVLGDELIGAAIVGYPREHRLNNGLTLAVRFIYTTGGRRAYGMLYGATARAASALGYCRIVAFLPENRSDSGLRAAGWKPLELTNSEKKRKPGRLCYEQRLLVRHRSPGVVSI